MHANTAGINDQCPNAEALCCTSVILALSFGGPVSKSPHAPPSRAAGGCTPQSPCGSPLPRHKFPRPWANASSPPACPSRIDSEQRSTSIGHNDGIMRGPVISTSIRVHSLLKEKPIAFQQSREPRENKTKNKPAQKHRQDLEVKIARDGHKHLIALLLLTKKNTESQPHREHTCARSGTQRWGCGM